VPVKSKAAKTAQVNVGAHCKGGLKGAVAHAREIGAQAVQIFIGSPQTWREPVPEPNHVKAFLEGIEEHELGPVFVHGNYLVNLASTSKDNLNKSVDNLAAALRLADMSGARGLVFHPGSALQSSYDEALGRVIKALEQVLSGYKGQCKLLLEVCAGQGQTIGARFVQFKDIFDAFGWDKRLGVCWDTCHLFNAGYDIATEKGLEQTIDEFDREVGFEWLYAIHANDSKNPLGARKDRHENIGEGHIGKSGFRRMLHHPQLKKYPWILEVPGFANEGPDKKNIDIMRTLAK
jgi:deoxyribonuclease-4